MEVRFHYDPETDLPHIYNHGVNEEEVLEVLRGSPLRLHGRRGGMFTLGQTLAGRHLKVIYKLQRDGILVITAYPLRGKALAAYRRRRRRKR
ncbi:MAG TPA: hypothetical protein VGR35_00690 [Tepidisphaeraceae bacterium]|nr:hypothetical protein [Tepidisphaeraceae bacterium]